MKKKYKDKQRKKYNDKHKEEKEIAKKNKWSDSLSMGIAVAIFVAMIVFSIVSIPNRISRFMDGAKNGFYYYGANRHMVYVTILDITILLFWAFMCEAGAKIGNKILNIRQKKEYKNQETEIIKYGKEKYGWQEVPKIKLKAQRSWDFPYIIEGIVYVVFVLVFGLMTTDFIFNWNIIRFIVVMAVSLCVYYMTAMKAPVIIKFKTEKEEFSSLDVLEYSKNAPK